MDSKYMSNMLGKSINDRLAEKGMGYYVYDTNVLPEYGLDWAIALNALIYGVEPRMTKDRYDLLPEDMRKYWRPENE